VVDLNASPKNFRIIYSLNLNSSTKAITHLKRDMISLTSSLAGIEDIVMMLGITHT
jgi:hypothetical protein